MVMEPLVSSHEVFVCQVCGVEGFTNAFIYCVNCLDSVIHRYCLKVMPRTFDELVIWHCGHCKPKVGNQGTLPKVKPLLSQKEEAASSGEVKLIHLKKKLKKKKNIASLIAKAVVVDCQEKANEPEVPIDSLKMKSNLGHKPTTSCVVARAEEGISSKPEDVHRLPKKDHTNRKELAARLDAKKKEHKVQSGLKTETRKPCTTMAYSNKHSRNGIQQTASNVKNKKSVVNRLEERTDETQPSQPPCKRRKLISDSPSMEKESDKTTYHECQVETANKLQTKLDGGTDVSQSAYFKNNVQDNYYGHARPVIDPVWRGSFSILDTDYDLFEGFVAHLSNKACDKVSNEANMLPSLLNLEMHPESVVWPKSFKECEPSDVNIALYFFPGDPINERVFDHLVVDMINKGLAMRAMAKNAELLIFTSRVLPRLFWRFQGKYYLWGVFRSKKHSSMSATSHDRTVSNDSDKCGLSKGSPNEVRSIKKSQ